jgi:DNA repair protein RadC
MHTSDTFGNYSLTGTHSEADILALAEDILRRRLERQGALTSPEVSADFLRMRIGALPHEEFHIVWLDTRHQVLTTERLFTGTIDGSSVYPREVVRRALQINAAAAVLSHNHPSGNPEPSSADRLITRRLQEALALIEVRVLDHLVIGAGSHVSMAARGWI